MAGKIRSHEEGETQQEPISHRKYYILFTYWEKCSAMQRPPVCVVNTWQVALNDITSGEKKQKSSQQTVFETS